MAASKPVIGSVCCGSPAAVDVLVALVVLVVAAVVLVELLVAGVAAGAADELPDDGDGDVLVGGGVVCVLVGVWVVVVVCPASGSVYWLSPAEGPLASAAGGAMPIAAASRSPGSQVLMTRHNGTPRVSHQRLSAGPGGACMETRKRLLCRISCSTRISRRVPDGSC